MCDSMVAVQTFNSNDTWLDSGCVAATTATGGASLKLTGELTQSKD